ncbi:MAG: DsrE/DsrF/DrsH-like family protein [Nitrospirae bacterium]|nr:DsrE/DsrF/DrsH-like family protein [Nitrospirota bacterium]
MTMDVMGVPKNDLVPGVEVCGAAAFLEYAVDANISLFV